MLDLLFVKVMTGGDNSCVTIWNVDHQQITDSLRQHTAWIWSIQFTKEGDYMFTCSSDRTMKVSCYLMGVVCCSFQNVSVANSVDSL